MSNYYETAQDLIRASNEDLNPKKWGFVIYRCTYSSQNKWDKFLSLIKEDAREYLENEKNQDLWESMEWSVVEDRELDGVDYKEARRKFDHWVRSELENQTEVDTETWMEPDCSEEEIFQYRLSEQPPRHQFFIFADEASVNSVVDCDKANNRGMPGGYYITLVQTGLLDRGEELHPEVAEEYDLEETDEDYWCDFRQKFKAWDVVALYASILNGDWPDGFAEHDGVSEIMRF